jgi:hypothetical protein
MKLSEIRKALLIKANDSFQELGFKKVGDLIVKNIDDYQIYIGFGVVDNDNSFPTTFRYGIAMKSLNNIKKYCLPERGFKLNDFSGAYGQKQTMLFDKKQYSILEYDIKSIADIDIMMNDLLSYFKDKALLELERLLSLDKLSVFINSEEVIKESMHQPTTSINGLILCKTSGFLNYETLKVKYRELLKDWSDWDKQELEKVISFLDNHSQEELMRIAESQ